MKNFVDNLFVLNVWQKRSILALIDASAVLSTLLLAFAARLETHKFLFERDTYIASVIALLCIANVFFVRKFYSQLTRHITTDSAITLVCACAFSTLGLFLFSEFNLLQIPRSVPFIHAVFCCSAIGGSRYFIRALAQNLNRQHRKNVAIYGAGVAGLQLLEALKWDVRYRVSQIIDDNPDLKGHRIAGLEVENFEASRQKFQQNKIDTLLLATPNPSAGTHQRIFDSLTETPVKIKTIPNLPALISGAAQLTELEDINVEQLLGRDPIQTDPNLATKTITGRSVLVTGAGGSIGSELCRQIVDLSPKQLILFDLSEFSIFLLLEELSSKAPSLELVPVIGSVQNREIVELTIQKFNIQTIYHAAAYKHVPLMEQNLFECIANNVFGTFNIVESAVRLSVRSFILVSTDKAVNPTNLMGATKRLSELICLAFGLAQKQTQVSAVRFGNVLGSSGSVVPTFKRQIAEGGPVNVTHEDVTRYFMTIPEAVQLVIQAGSMANFGNMFVLDMGSPVKILDLAKRMITLSGKRPKMDQQNVKTPSDIHIQITGLRPGEKLHEELTKNSDLIPTSHPRIFSISEQTITIDEMERIKDELIQLSKSYDFEGVFELLSTVADYSRSSIVESN